jgi:hypothetical protein
MLYAAFISSSALFLLADSDFDVKLGAPTHLHDGLPA